MGEAQRGRLTQAGWENPAGPPVWEEAADSCEGSMALVGAVSSPGWRPQASVCLLYSARLGHCGSWHLCVWRWLLGARIG